jgi:RNA polymerase sigma-70 factor (ECF subfamily)
MTARSPNERGRGTSTPLPRSSDEHAFAALVRRHASIAHRAAYVITRNASDADDALQEGTVKAWRALGRFDPERGFRPWFTTIVANTARNRARAWNRREAATLRLRLDGSPSDPADDAVSRDEAEAVLREVERLPERYRRAVALRHVLGLSERETADALGIRPGTVREALGEGWS